MRSIVIDFRKLDSPKKVHKFLAEKLAFPSYYGRNLDALHDLLSEIDQDTTVYLISGGHEFEDGFEAVFADVREENEHFFTKSGEIAQILEELERVDSPSAYCDKIIPYLNEWWTSRGFETKLLRKGGVLVTLGGEGNPLILMSHADTLGAVVGEIKGNGHIKMSNVTLNANNIETENCRVITDDGRVLEGTVQLTNPSIHVNGEFSKTERSFDSIEVVLDENVSSKEEVEALGVQPGDVVAVDPRFVLTDAGYIKSRYQDDKASVAIIMSMANDIKNGNIKLKRKVYFLITMYEEYAMGGACGIPEDVEDILCVDMGCVGDGIACTEHEVSICRKDSRNVYNREMTHELMECAKAAKISASIDIYPHYSSDANVAMQAGYDLRHALIGPGIYASHGYERSHLDGLTATKELLEAYLGE